MKFSLIFLIACVACRANNMEMINTYLDQMTARVGYSVNYALDKAFAETASGSDIEIYALKKDVIDQAKSMFRPLARNILVDSLQPRLQKRFKQSRYSEFDSKEYSRHYSDFDEPNGKIDHSYSSVEHEIHPEIKSSLFEDAERHYDSLYDSPLSPGNLDSSQHGHVSGPSDWNQPRKNMKGNWFKYDRRSYRDEVLYEEISSTAKHARGKSWNIQFAKKFKEIVARCLQALKYVLEKLNLGKLTESFGDRFSNGFHSVTAHIPIIALLGVGLGYLVHSFIRTNKFDDHEYFD